VTQAAHTMQHAKPSAAEALTFSVSAMQPKILNPNQPPTCDKR